MRISRALDFVLYISIGIGLVAAIIWYVESGWSDPERHAARQQIACSVFGALVIGRTSYVYRRHVRSLWFWASLLLILAAQVTALMFALRHKDWELFHWGFPVAGELYIIGYLMNRYVLLDELQPPFEH